MADRIGWGNFPNLPDDDRFAVSITAGTPGVATIGCGTGPAVTWWKAYKLVDRATGRIVREFEFEGTAHGPRTHTVNAAEAETMKFVLAKAKLFGVHTDMYEIFELRDAIGSRIDLNWLTDGPSDFIGSIVGFFRDLFRPIIRFFVTVINLIIQLVVAIVTLFLNIIALPLNLLTGVPGFGRLVGLILGGINFVLQFAAGLIPEVLSWVGGLFGGPRIKIMRLGVVIQRDPAGTPVATPAEVVPRIEFAQRLFQLRCEILLVPYNVGVVFPYRSAPYPPEDFIVTNDKTSSAATLDLSCGEAGFFEDLGVSGAGFEAMVSLLFFGGAIRRFGSGAPIYAFAVRRYAPAPDGTIPVGCCSSLDYITVDFVGSRFVSTLAHEIAHSCGLLHTPRAGAFNLMQPGRIEPSPLSPLTPWLDDPQVFVIRASPRTTAVY